MSNEQGKPVGSLYDDLGTVARKVHAITGEHPVVVWADEAGAVRAVKLDVAPNVPQRNIAGVFDSTGSAELIEEDLTALLRSRTRGALLD